MPELDYGFKAIQTLWIDQVRAHNPGDWVPAENVDLYGWEEGVDVEKCPLPAPDPEEEAGQAPPPSQPPEAPPAAPEPAHDIDPEPGPDVKPRARRTSH